ncbi:MAG: hypothetical protein DRG59_11255 [Deltaproteobacteria bacterium]|nr:MAG: hypothetical protein DRG59_11255 [Deltaproteobacteria bacterium]RLB05341.1 MAG: hypothetical protein DRG83_02880 [Deltaproteobacteria bacterium]
MDISRFIKKSLALVRRSPGKILILVAAYLPFSGCAAVPPAPPPPPLLGTPGVFGMGWIIILVLAAVVFLLWKKGESGNSTQEDHISDAVNNMNDRLKRLEEKMEEISKIVKR